MSICRNPNCGKENPNDFVFCKYCGRRLKELKNNSKKPLMILIVAAALVLVLIFTKVLLGLGGEKDPAKITERKTKIFQSKSSENNISNAYNFLFVRGQGNAKEIYINNQNTVVKITNSNAINLYPSWSPDKTKIAFERKEGNISGIYVINADGTNEKRIAEGCAPTWSADGIRVVFFSKSKDSSSNILYSINFDGTDLKEMTTTKDSYFMARYSPDGSKIALSKFSLEGWGIYLVNPDMSGRKAMTLNVKMENEPTWSFDSSKLAFTSQMDGNYEIYTQDMNRNITRLTNNPAADYSPSFTPDGKVVFTREEAGGSNLYIVNADGTNEKLLLKDAAFGVVGK